MLKKKITVEKTREEIPKVACSRCNIKTNHKVLSTIKLFWDETKYEVQGIDLYETISCLGCEELSFRLTSSNSQEVEMDEDGKYINPETEELYPNRLVGRPPLREQYSLPEKIRSMYKETHAALSSKLKILAGIGIRALIEAVCIEEKAEGADLKKRIDSLVEKGVLTQSSATTLHKTRFLGNRSAHEIEAAMDEELGVAFDILENLLMTVYIIPKKAKNLKG